MVTSHGLLFEFQRCLNKYFNRIVSGCFFANERSDERWSCCICGVNTSEHFWKSKMKNPFDLCESRKFGFMWFARPILFGLWIRLWFRLWPNEKNWMEILNSYQNSVNSNEILNEIIILINRSIKVSPKWLEHFIELNELSWVELNWIESIE